MFLIFAMVTRKKFVDLLKKGLNSWKIKTVVEDMNKAERESQSI